MRTFIAFELSSDIKNEFAELQEKLKKAGADVKWVNPNNIHLTLKFFGEISDDKVAPISKILDEISSENRPFKISLSGLGAFPDLNRPRVLWVGIGEGASSAEQIAKSLENNLEKLGFSKEERPFRAHFTLGRVKSGKNKSELKQKILSLEPRPASCTINSITFFRSILTPKGPIYTSIYAGRFISE